MFKKLLFIPFLALLATSAAFAQTSQEEITSDDLRNLVRYNVVEGVQATETIGSPYLFDNFEEGIITLADGKNTATLQLNFNIYENRVEFSDAGGVIAVDNEMVDTFVFTSTGSELIFTKGFDSRRLNSDEFVQILVDEPVKLLKKHEISFQENVASYGTATQKDEYISNERFYIHEDGETKQIRSLRERRVLRTLNDHRDEMETYIDENDLNLGNTGDLVRLIEYYNEIKE